MSELSGASPLARVRVVLYEPLDPVNIAATVRAMKNMGIADLRLVRPAPYDASRIERVAHDTRDLVERIVHTETLDAALEGTVRVAAFTARRRAAKWLTVAPRDAADDLIRSASDGDVAVVFGREDKGLPNDALDRAHLHVMIPTTDHPSLNLAQAVMIALYELHVTAADATRQRLPPRKDAPPPTSEELELYFADVELALASIDFFKTRQRGLILRTLRSLTLRSGADAREVTLLRAIAIEVRKAIARLRHAP